MEFVPASAWFANPRLTDDDRTRLAARGIVPISDSFLPAIESRKRYQIIYGGRGSGKSETVARKLVGLCRTEPYFRCIYTRKVSEVLRESCFSLLQKIIRDYGFAREFSINKATMSIVHNPTGNSFIAKGLDNPEKVKSTDEPSHLWCEEPTELNEEDFNTLDDSIRTSRTQPMAILTFNPVLATSWVRHKFFHPDDPHQVHPDYAEDTYLMRSTYLNNDFIDKDAYLLTLTRNSAGDNNRLRVNVTGDWGLAENKSPWLYAFSKDKHTRPDLIYLSSFPIYLAFDFNRDPVTATAYQMSPQKGTRDSFIHVLREFGGRVQLQELCGRIRTTYPHAIFFVTGDSSGKKGDVTYNSEHDSAYSLIQSYLGLTRRQMQPNNYNLRHENSRLLCNTMLANYPNFLISAKGCPNLINDMEIAETSSTGTSMHALRKDRDTFKMDYFDGWRYFLQAYFAEFAKTAYFRVTAKPQQAKPDADLIETPGGVLIRASDL